MGIVFIIKKSFNLFRSSFQALLPILVAGCVCSGVADYLVYDAKYMATGFRILAAAAFYLFSALMSVSLFLGVYWHHKKTSFNFWQTIIVSISKFPKYLLLNLLLALPVIIALKMSFLPHIIENGIVFENLTLEWLSEWVDNLNSVPLLLLIAALFYSAYLSIVYGFLGELILITSQATLSESMSKSKMLIQNYKWHVLKCLILIFLFSVLTNIACKQLMGEKAIIILQWFIYAPIQTCLVVSLYHEIVKIKNVAEPESRASNNIESAR